MEIKAFQDLMNTLFFHRDKARGLQGTFTWLVEEIGELAKEIRKHDASTHSRHDQLEQEIADVFAWLCSVANLVDVDIEHAVRVKYPGTCSKCGSSPCACKP